MKTVPVTENGRHVGNLALNNVKLDVMAATMLEGFKFELTGVVVDGVIKEFTIQTCKCSGLR